MRSGTRNTRKLKVRFYADCIIDHNNYTADFPGVKASHNIGDTEFNKIVLKICQTDRVIRRM